MLILGIETSCDETSAAVVENGTKVLSNIIRSSLKKHQKYGGVVPEIAAREHLKIMIPVIKMALEEAKVPWEDIDAIAYTETPGLIGSLLIGINTARALAKTKNKPLIPVNHIHGHIYSNWLESEQKPTFPILVLTVSGGHNDLFLMKTHYDFELIGETIDDAAGEAFDKVAKILKFGYPGGPIISKKSEKGDPKKYDFPRAWLKDSKNSFNFSFSGLKTSVLYTVRKISKITAKIKTDIAASFQEAVCDVLATKLIKAAEKYDTKEIHLAGGVSANLRLRALVKEKIKELNKKIVLKYPKKLIYCTDNAAMIASAGYFKCQKLELTHKLKIKSLCN